MTEEINDIQSGPSVPSFLTAVEFVQLLQKEQLYNCFIYALSLVSAHYSVRHKFDYLYIFLEQ